MSIVSFHKILKETKAVLAAGGPDRAKTGGLAAQKGRAQYGFKKTRAIAIAATRHAV